MENLPNITPHDGRFIGRKHYFACRIYYEDTDFSGIVYHANYLKYLERARSDMLSRLNMDQRAAFERGDGAYAITELAVKYISPARLDDNLLVVTTVSNVRRASVAIDQIIFRNQDMIASASVQAAFLTPAGRPRRQPTSWTNAFASVMNPTDRD